jgi:hypothetical protein
MKYPTTGKLKAVNGTLKTIENGKQKIQIDSSITLRRPKMIKKWWKKFMDWFFKGFYD